MSTIKRAFIERRSGKDERRSFHVGRLFYKRLEIRPLKDRRTTEKKQDNRVNLSKWSSVPLGELKNLKVPKISCLIKSFFRTSF